jgi:hypothetical protein
LHNHLGVRSVALRDTSDAPPFATPSPPLPKADYSAYFDSRAAPTGAQNVEFAAFSLRAVKAAEARLADFLALMPADDVDAARANVGSFAAAAAAAEASGAE